ncbi:hypothetical protein [Tsukamurella pseudospumae]|nr:hypothetical protein [Tsukamurella pseudospumae]
MDSSVGRGRRGQGTTDGAGTDAGARRSGRTVVVTVTATVGDG